MHRQSVKSNKVKELLMTNWLKRLVGATDPANNHSYHIGTLTSVGHDHKWMGIVIYI
jgi:hypothetical protein